MDDNRYVFVCTNADCRLRGAMKVLDRLVSRLKDAGCPNVDVREYICFGGCREGPNIVIFPDTGWYGGVKEEDAGMIVDKHLKHGEIVTALTGKGDEKLETLIYQLLDSVGF